MIFSTDVLIARFHEWLDAARAHPHIAEPTAMNLATIGPGGTPDSRIVLLKEADARGFTFFTNLRSAKSRQLVADARAALCFYWMPLARQLRIQGGVEPLDDAQADAYFASRARESQLGAWASQQSEVLASREELLRRFEEARARFEGMPVTRPPHWSGWRVVPLRMEFWQEGAHRLHVRECYRRDGEGWKLELLNP